MWFAKCLVLSLDQLLGLSGRKDVLLSVSMPLSIDKGIMLPLNGPYRL